LGVLLLITNSFDTTADLLIARLGAKSVFRFNFDIWSDYRFDFRPEGISIADPTGWAVGSENIAKVLWRKPRSRAPFRPTSSDPESRFYDLEVWYALRDAVNLLWLDRKIVLAEPLAELRAGKFVQMRAAAHHFMAPACQFRLGSSSRFGANEQVVVKSLTMEPVGEDTKRELLFTTRVDEKELSPNCPWMVQKLVEADRDVTVAVVRDALFAFEQSRNALHDRLVDWRELSGDAAPNAWRRHQLPPGLESAIFAFMDEMGLQFGRLDFLLNELGYHFLEVNTNGEWAWLDPDGRHGLLPKVVDEISPDTPIHPIPFPRGIG